MPCPDPQNQTNIDGECKDDFVDSSTLPDFDQGQLGDSTNPGSCFDFTRCFADAVTIPTGAADGAPPPPPGGVTLDLTSCVVSSTAAIPRASIWRLRIGYRRMRPSGRVLRADSLRSRRLAGLERDGAAPALRVQAGERQEPAPREQRGDVRGEGGAQRRLRNDAGRDRRQRSGEHAAAHRRELRDVDLRGRPASGSSRGRRGSRA